MPESKPILPVISERWSPYSFTPKPIEPATLASLFDAARWAASSFNEQPWRFIIATQAEPEKFARVLGVLVPKNRDWAKNAWLLGITAGKKTFTVNGMPDRFGLHDAGAALAQLMLQATAEGLHAHGMGGFDADRARAEFGVPDDFEVGAAFAVGYSEATAPAGRTRKPLGDLVFTTEWGKPAL